jgi:hypothetical protein
MAAAPRLEIAAQGAKNPATLAFLRDGPKKLLIDGKWVAAKSGKTFESINPANEEVLVEVAEAGPEDIDEAVKAARKAFEEGPWSRMTPHQRTRVLLKVADLIEQNREQLAELSSLDNGAPIMGGQGLVTSANELFTYFAGWPSKIYGETSPSAPDMFNYTLREPIGVCGQIIPWNGPLMSASNKLAHALSTGNTVVLKPAEQACLVVLRLGELLMEAGVPEGVVNIVPGFGPVAGAALSNHPDVDKIAFTGSTTTGKEILKASVATLKHVSLELGGKSPHVIFADADLEPESSATPDRPVSRVRASSCRRTSMTGSSTAWCSGRGRTSWARSSNPASRWDRWCPGCSISACSDTSRPAKRRAPKPSPAAVRAHSPKAISCSPRCSPGCATT